MLQLYVLYIIDTYGIAITIIIICFQTLPRPQTIDSCLVNFKQLSDMTGSHSFFCVLLFIASDTWPFKHVFFQRGSPRFTPFYTFPLFTHFYFLFLFIIVSFIPS